MRNCALTLALLAAFGSVASAQTVTVINLGNEDPFDGPGGKGPLLGGSNAAYHLIGGVPRAPSGKALTIQPGARLKFGSRTGLTVIGTLVCGDNNSNQRAVFTSLRDDTVAGDTNGDGGRTTPAAGNWRSVTVSGTAKFENTEVRFGNEVRMSHPAAQLDLDNCLIRGELFGGIEANGHLALTINNV